MATRHAIKRLYQRIFSRFTINNPGKAAAYVSRLNQWAKPGNGGYWCREDPYRLKDHFIEWAYKAGYCSGVVERIQKIECNRCRGLGRVDTQGVAGELPCYSCHGSGIYLTTTLYLFTFDFGQMGYRWHMPKSLVNWNVARDRFDVSRYMVTPPRKAPVREFDPYKAMDYVSWFLVNRGFNLPHDSPSVWGAIYEDLRLWKIHRAWLKMWGREDRYISKDEIPF